MAFPPNQSSARGDVHSLARICWFDNGSNLVGVAGGKQYVGSGWGQADYNYDDAEGWAPRINYHGTSDQVPWNGIDGGTGTIDHTSKTGMASLRRKNEGAVGSTTGTSAYVLKIQNQNGAYDDEVYTDKYHGLSGGDLGYIVSLTPNNQQWYISWYARKSGTNSSDPVRMTCYVFGLGWDGSQYIYTFGGATIANGKSGTLASPATGGTGYYIGRHTLTTSWTKYESSFILNGDTDISALSIRWDVDDGVSGGTTTVYIDRPILYPVDVHFGASGADAGSNPDSFQSASTGSYAT